MWWMLAAQVGMSLLQQNQQNKSTKAQNKIAANNTANENKVRAATNEIGAAAGALQRVRQSLFNQNILENAAKNAETIGQNLGRQLDNVQAGKLNTQIQAAETSGSLIAMASAAGVAGSTVDVINSTIRGQAARNLAEQDRNAKLMKSDAKKAIGAAQEQGILGMDTTFYVDRVSQVQAIAQQQQTTSPLAMLSGALLGAATSQAGQNALASTGSWFKSAPASAGSTAAGYKGAFGF
jgi:HAMP domain-containing protein